MTSNLLTQPKGNLTFDPPASACISSTIICNTPQFLISIILEKAQKLMQLATKPIRIAQASDSLDTTRDRMPITMSIRPQNRSEYQKRPSQAAVGDFKLASQTHQSSSPSASTNQQAPKNFLPKFLLTQKSTAAITVTTMQSVPYSMMGGRANRAARIRPFMVRISKMNCLFGVKVLLEVRVFDFDLQRIELSIFIIG